jgi:hypothetical protein
MDLERELSALTVAWPETPELRLELGGARVRSRRPLLVAIAVVALVLAALAAAFAVPQSRGAILRFLHLGGVTIELVDTLPAAQERPLTVGLGPVVSAAYARGHLGTPPLGPPLDPAPQLHFADGVVSLVFVDRGTPVILSELGGDDPGIVKKLFRNGPIEFVHVGGAPGYWITGTGHVVTLPPSLPPRLAGNVLLWQTGGLTLRLEGRGLTLARALELARSFRLLRDTP